MQVPRNARRDPPYAYGYEASPDAPANDTPPYVLAL